MTRSTLKDFEVLSRLGSGSFGTVFRVRRIIDDGVYVIKTVRIVELSYKEQTEAINEVQILAQLKSPYVVRYYDSFIEKDSLHIVMEFCNRGDLQNLIRKAKEKNVAGLKENVIWNIAIQVMLGLQYLHRKHILHRDLKSANVFLMKDEQKTHYLVKIGDLGVAKLMDTSTALANTIVGTPYYLSPELCMDMPYRDKSDCWAFGVLLYESCTLEHPFEARNQCALIMKIIEAVVKPPSASSVSKELRNLILWLLQKDPNRRPSIRDILCEEFVREKMEEHRFDLPAELVDCPLTNYLLERDFERDAQQSRKRKSSIKVLSEIAHAQSQALTATEGADEHSQEDEGGGIAFHGKDTADTDGGGGGGGGGGGTDAHGGWDGKGALPRHERGSKSPPLNRPRGGSGVGGAGGEGSGNRKPSPSLANYPAARGSRRSLEGGSPTSGGREVHRQPSSRSISPAQQRQQQQQQQFLVAGNGIGGRGKSSRALDTGAGGGGGGGGVDPPAPAIRGNRVRGPSFRGRDLSDRALNRHQVARPIAAADSKLSGGYRDQTGASPPPVTEVGRFMREPSKKLDIDFDDPSGASGTTGAVEQHSHDHHNAAQLRAESKTPTEYEEDEFEDYDQSLSPVRPHDGKHTADTVAGAAARSGASPTHYSNGPAPMLGEGLAGIGQRGPSRRSFKADVEDLDTAELDDFDTDHHHNHQYHDSRDRPPFLASNQRGKSFKEIDDEVDYPVAAARSPSSHLSASSPFRDTDSRSSISGSMQINNSSGGGSSGRGGGSGGRMLGESSQWDPVWTQTRGVIQSSSLEGEDGWDGQASGGVGKAGPAGEQRQIRRIASDTADFAMGPLKDEDAESTLRMHQVRDSQEFAGLGDTEQPSNEDIGALVDLIDEARNKAISALGHTMYQRVYDLCSKHMLYADDDAALVGAAGMDRNGDPSDPSGGQSIPPRQSFIQELEQVLCMQPDGSSAGGIEVACEAVFGIKLLLALESKYESFMKHMDA